MNFRCSKHSTLDVAISLSIGMRFTIETGIVEIKAKQHQKNTRFYSENDEFSCILFYRVY